MMVAVGVGLDTPMPPLAGAAPAPDVAVSLNSGQNYASTDLIQLVVVVPAGTNQLMLVAVNFRDPAGENNVVSIDYDGTPLTEVGSPQASGFVTARLYKLLAPAAGTKTVTVHFDEGLNPVSAGLEVLVLDNVHQTTPLGTAATASGTSTAPAVTAAGVAAGDMVIDNMGADLGSGSQSATVGAGRTELRNLTCGTSPNKMISAQAKRQDGSGSMAWTLSGSKPWCIKAVAVKKA